MPRNWEARDKKLEKRKNGMKVDGKSVFIMQAARQRRDKALRDTIRRPDERDDR